ncbi:recombinase family protein [Streptomyces triculaminicus]|nr:recombinase family protein [Streptomyces triculaminicus]
MEDMGTPPERPRWGILARKSKVYGKGDRRRELSTEAQIETGHREAAEAGAEVPPEFVWAELGSAYKDREREDFDEALAALAAGKISVLWCYRLDRFSRKGAEDLLRVIGKVRVIFWYDRLDSMEPGDRRRIIDYAEQAREYSERLSHNVVQTKQVQRERGEWLGVHPFGLRPNRDRKLEHGERWPVVERIFYTLAEGKVSGRGLVLDMNREGELSPGGKSWSVSTLSRIVNHPVYEGWQIIRNPAGNSPVNLVYKNARRHRVGVFAEGFEPIPAAIVKKARQHLSRRDPAPNSHQLPQQGKAQSLLADALRCHGCKGPMVTVSRESYGCYRHHQQGLACPAPAFVSKKPLEEYAAVRWINRIGGSDAKDPLLLAVAERWALLTRPEETQAHREALEAVETAQKRMRRLMMDRNKGRYDLMEDLFEEHEREALQDLKDARALLAEHGPTTSLDAVGFLTEPEQVQELWDTATLPMQRDLLRLAIDYVTVKKSPKKGTRFDGNQRVTIKWAKAGKPVAHQPDGKHDDGIGTRAAAA